MRLPQLTQLVIGSIYGRVRQIRPVDDIVDLTGGDVVDLDLRQDVPAQPAAERAGAPPR